MPMAPAEIEKLIKESLPDATVRIEDLAEVGSDESEVKSEKPDQD